MKRKTLSRPQAIGLLLLWIILCFIVLTSNVTIDGPLILSLFVSGALVGIPLWRSFK